MKFPIITFLLFVILATYAEILPAQIYWKLVLPNTPIPKAIIKMLPNYPMPKTITNLQLPGVDLGVRKGYDDGDATEVNFKELLLASFFYHHAASKDSVNHVANVTQSHAKPSETEFFLEKDLFQGSKSNFHFSKTADKNDVKFLSRDIANSIPFSSNKTDEILKKLNIKKGSEAASIAKHSINVCEVGGIKGDKKLCVTSLESMIDFITARFGKNVLALTTEGNKESPFQQYKIIGKGVTKLGEKNNVVVCHKMNYPYAVFYCHKTDKTKVYSVHLKGADGSIVNAIAVCHSDTSDWDPKHPAFQVLKIKPGTLPICHLLPIDNNIAWISK